jgi:hypothetical protein
LYPFCFVNDFASVAFSFIFDSQIEFAEAVLFDLGRFAAFVLVQLSDWENQERAMKPSNNITGSRVKFIIHLVK